MEEIHYTYSLTTAGRKHRVSGADIDVLLRRIPEELWSRLRVVHFNDKSFGNRTLGYVTGSRREIALCALPTGISFGRVCRRYEQKPRWFGAAWGHQWSDLAVRRLMLYEVFLHELGHLQVVDKDSPNIRRRFALEKKAQEFADHWRKRLWLERFEHADRVHNPPSAQELRNDVGP